MLLHHRNPLQVVLVLPSLESVSINGSGASTVNGFIGDKADVQLHGSGNLKFNGRYREVVGRHATAAAKSNSMAAAAKRSWLKWSAPGR